jgi:hypothetical protein
MTNDIGEISQRSVARVAGLLYLLFVVTFASSFFVQGKPVVSADAAATARNIMASQWLFRIGFTSELLAALLFLLSAWALYVLLQPVNRSLALLFVLLNAVGVAVESMSLLIRFDALLLLSGDSYVNAFKTDQQQALAMLLLNAGGNGGMVSALFYGVWLFPLAFLVIKSRFIPKVFGILLIADGCSVLICFFQMWLFPGYEKLTYSLYPVMFIAEFGFALWLLIMGAKEKGAGPDRGRVPEAISSNPS